MVRSNLRARRAPRANRPRLCKYSQQNRFLNTGAQELDAVGNSEEIPLQGVAANFGGGTIALSCWEFSNSDRVDANNAAVTAIKAGSVQ
jgi:hypothetical protein